MTTAEIDYLDGEFQVQENEPNTIEELVALIGENGVVDETTSNLRYRNKYPRVYKKVSDGIAAAPNNYPKAVKGTKKNKDGTEKKIHESDMDHIRAFLKGRFDESTPPVQTEAPPTGSRAVLQSLFDTHGQAEPLFLKGERAGGGGKLSQAALDAANTQIAAGDAKVEKVVEYIETRVSGYKVGRDADGMVTPESLARGIQALGAWQKKKAEREAKAELDALA